MKKMFLKAALICALLTNASIANSQVTIGSAKAPAKGALLDLKEELTNPSANETARKGLGLPRVHLQDYNTLKMGANVPELADKKKEHTGLLVYNVNPAFDECEAASIPSGLHVWNGDRWEGLGTPQHYSPTPPDISSPIFQPNAYMVTTVGSASSVSIPVAKAFAVWEYWASEEGGKKLQPRTFSGTLSVAVEWQEGMGQANNTIVGAPSLSSTSVSDRNATITVPTTGNMGNAVVSLSDANGVLWSWHIWVTAQPSTTVFNGLTWLDRNLGATSATPAADGTIGLHYQWGRHTPIPGYRKFDGTPTSVAITATPIASALTSDGNTPVGQNALMHAIKSPKSFITNTANSYDWYSTINAQWDTRWAEQTKDICDNLYDVPSITNPCPAGWKVPVGTNNHNTSPWKDLTTTSGTWNNGYNWTTPAAPAGYYPAAGYRFHNNGSLGYVGYYGLYWSASPYSISARFLYFFSGYVSPWNYDNRTNGFSVRCVQE